LLWALYASTTVLTLDRAVNSRPAGFVNFVDRCDRFATGQDTGSSCQQGLQSSTGRSNGAIQTLVIQAYAEASHNKRLFSISVPLGSVPHLRGRLGLEPERPRGCRRLGRK
jgi:hypothetical protein